MTFPNPRALAAAAAMCLLAVIGLTLSVADHPPLPAELRAAEWFRAWAAANGWGVDLAMVLRWLGSAVILTPLLIGVVIALSVRGHRGWAAWLAACSVGGLLLSELVKNTVMRERPTWPEPYYDATGYSFPSGHAMASIYGWVPLGIVCLYLLRPPWQKLLGISAIAIGVLMGPSRWVLGVHWITDVLAGWLLAAGWVLAVSAVAVGRAQTTARAPGRE